MSFDANWLMELLQNLKLRYLFQIKCRSKEILIPQFFGQRSAQSYWIYTWNHPETFHPRYGKLNFRHESFDEKIDFMRNNKSFVDMTLLKMDFFRQN